MQQQTSLRTCTAVHVSHVAAVVCRLIADQRVKNAAAEKLEEQALQARMHAEAAGERIQQCQDSLQAAERLLAEKRRELTTKVGCLCSPQCLCDKRET